MIPTQARRATMLLIAELGSPQRTIEDRDLLQTLQEVDIAPTLAYSQAGRPGEPLQVIAGLLAADIGSGIGLTRVERRCIRYRRYTYLCDCLIQLRADTAARSGIDAAAARWKRYYRSRFSADLAWLQAAIWLYRWGIHVCVDRPAERLTRVLG